MTQRENATDQSSHVAEHTQLRTAQRAYWLVEFLVWCAEAARPEACETVCRNSLFLLLSHSVMSYSLWPHGLQHSRLPGPSPSPGVFQNSCPLSRWYHLTISFSVIPFSSCLQSSQASGSFPLSQFFISGGQSIGASASVSVLTMNIQDWFPSGLTGLISLLSKGLSRVFSITTVIALRVHGKEHTLRVCCNFVLTTKIFFKINSVIRNQC